VADLTSDAGWAQAVAGCADVLHVASPFPMTVPKNEDDLIVPARDGTLRVLRAARDAGVRRVVVTSSSAAIAYGHAPTARSFTEETWTNPDRPGVGPYQKSKTLAERAAWDFIAREGGALELAVVNPVGILGPALGAPLSTSVDIVKQMLERALPALPQITFCVVDVRDVADLHVLAMTDPAANGQRFLAVAGEPMSLRDIALMLRARLGTAARRVPTRTIPNWTLRLAAGVVPSLRPITGELGTVRATSNEKAKRVLGWAPRTNEEAIVATGESLMRLGLVGGATKAA